MSHFSIAVIMDGSKTLEEMMAPYMEYSAGVPEDRFLQFYPASEDEYYTDGYASGSATYVVEPGDPTLRLKYDKRYVNPQYDALDLFGKRVDKYVFPEGSRFVEVPHKLVYPTFESFMEEWHEASRDERTGEFGYWQNPNAKWDWYTTWEERGWSDEFLGGPFGRIGDMSADRDALRAKAARKYDELVAEGGIMLYMRTRGMTREQFVESEGHFHYRAVITSDGVWHEVGDMGWWGMSSETADEMYDWDVHFEERFIDPADPDWRIVMVDCHI